MGFPNLWVIYPILICTPVALVVDSFAPPLEGSFQGTEAVMKIVKDDIEDSEIKIEWFLYLFYAMVEIFQHNRKRD